MMVTSRLQTYWPAVRKYLATATPAGFRGRPVHLSICPTADTTASNHGTATIAGLRSFNPSAQILGHFMEGSLGFRRRSVLGRACSGGIRATCAAHLHPRRAAAAIRNNSSSRRGCGGVRAVAGAGSDDDEATSFEEWLRRNPLPGRRGRVSGTYLGEPRPCGPTSGPTPTAAGPQLSLHQLQGSNHHDASDEVVNSPGVTASIASCSSQGPSNHKGRSSSSGSGSTATNKGGAGGGAGRTDRTSSAAAVRSRDFQVSELIAVLEALTPYPRVDWDARRLTWVAYLAGAAAAGGVQASTVQAGDPRGQPGRSAVPRSAAAPAAFLAPDLVVSEWVPALQVELPRLAPRPAGCGFGSKAARRQAAGGGGGEGWETGTHARGDPDAIDAAGVDGGKALLLSYLDELRGCQRDMHESQVRPLQCQLYGSTEQDRSAGTALSTAWDDLEVLPDAEELGMLREEEEEEELQEEEELEEEEENLSWSEVSAGGGVSGAVAADLTALQAGVAPPAARGGGSAAAGRRRMSRSPAPPAARMPPVDAALVLLSADSAALGIWLGGRLVRHKVLTGYTVRHSAGGSQARRDRRAGGGGGRSVGAALRRAEAARLWQATAARLAEWAPELSACRVLVRSGDTRVFAQLYEARRPPPPIDLRDPRWEGAGVSVPRPRLRDLLAVHRRLSSGRMEWLSGGERGQ